MAIVDVRPCSTPDQDTAAAIPVRLVLRHPSRVGGWVDGGWWPGSLALAIELVPLLAAIHRAGFDTAAVAYNLTGWAPAGVDLVVTGRLVSLRGYRSQEPDSITLTDRSGWDRLDLLVIPPDTSRVSATSALRAAGGSDVRHPYEILHHPGRATAPQRVVASHELMMR